MFGEPACFSLDTATSAPDADAETKACSAALPWRGFLSEPALSALLLSWISFLKDPTAEQTDLT
jgi:hypothetical protein